MYIYISTHTTKYNIMHILHDIRIQCRGYTIYTYYDEHNVEDIQHICII